MEKHSRGGSLWEMLDASFIRIPVGAAQLLAVIVRAPLLAAQLATDIISVPFLLAQIVVAHLRDQTERMDARLQDTVTGLIGQRPSGVLSNLQHQESIEIQDTIDSEESHSLRERFAR